MRKSIIGGIAALSAAALLLAGCTSSETSNSSGVAADTLTIQSSAPTSLNPAVGPIGQTGDIYIYSAYAALIFQKSDGSFVPDLATKWGYVDGSNNEKFTLTVRSGVKFSDGTELDAQAVVNSIKYFIAAKGPQSAQLATLQSITATGTKTVEFDFSSPTPAVPFLLSQWLGIGAIIGPKGLAHPDSLATTSDGAGPYTIASSGVIANQQYTYHASPTYYNPSAVHFKTVVVTVTTDQNAILSGLQGGQLDAATPFALPGIVDPAKSAGLNVDGAPQGIMTLFFADRAGSVVPAFGNVKVRQAINYALDRKSLATLIGGSNGTPTNQLSLPGSLGYSDSNSNEYAYDISKAKQLLSEAGYANGFSFSLLDAEAVDPNGLVGQAVVAALGQIGIKVTLQTEAQFSQFIPEALSKKYPAILFATPYFGDGYYYAAETALSTFENPFNSNNPQLDHLFAVAAAAADTATEKADLDKVSQWLLGNAWFAPIASTTQNVIWTNKIQGVQKIAAGQQGSYNPFGPTSTLSWSTK
ncbi:MAG TPA: ABC transporter substrate-binding protein [Solirubrobacteraceae bacterium]|nr:ABC transporter substrate-binding protein [Solirubrobacteraceae bacterium]